MENTVYITIQASGDAWEKALKIIEELDNLAALSEQAALAAMEAE